MALKICLNSAGGPGRNHRSWSVFHAFTLSPFSIVYFHIKSLLAHSSRESAKEWWLLQLLIGGLECWQHPLDLCTEEKAYCLSSFSWETPISFSVFQSYFQFQSSNYNVLFTILAALFSELFQFLPEGPLPGGPRHNYHIPRSGKQFICCFFYILGALIKISSQEAKCSISLCTDVGNMSIPSQVLFDGHTKVFNGIHIFEDHSLWSVISLSFICSLPSYLHLTGGNLIPHFLAQHPNLSISLWSFNSVTRLSNFKIANHLWTVFSVSISVEISLMYKETNNGPRIVPSDKLEPTLKFHR